MPRFGSIALACLLCACKPKLGDCDRARVEELVAQLDAAAPRERPNLLHEHLGQACTVPGRLQAYLDHLARVGTEVANYDIRSRAMMVDHDAFTRVCPTYGAVWKVVVDLPPTERGAYLYEHCHLDRYKLGTAEDGITRNVWSLHHWLLEQGLSNAQARSISLAVHLSDWRAYTPAGTYAGLTLPEVPEIERLRAVEGWPVIVTTETVLYDDPFTAEKKSLASITDGRIDAVESYESAVAKLWGNDDWTELDIAADRNTRLETILKVARTGTRALGSSFGLVVETRPFIQGSLPFELSSPDVTPDLRVDMDARAQIVGLCAEAAPGSTVEITGRASSTADALAQALAAVLQLDCVGRVVVSASVDE